MADNSMQDQQTGPKPGGPDAPAETSPGGKVGPRGTVEGHPPAGAEAEPKSFKEKDLPDPNDLLGPAGDPAEGKPPPGGSTWPA
jgi:hypothetical protein